MHIHEMKMGIYIFVFTYFLLLNSMGKSCAPFCKLIVSLCFGLIAFPRKFHKHVHLL